MKTNSSKRKNFSVVRLPALLLLAGTLSVFVLSSTGCFGCSSSSSSSSKSYTDAEYKRAEKAVIDADRNYYRNYYNN